MNSQNELVAVADMSTEDVEFDNAFMQLRKELSEKFEAIIIAQRRLFRADRISFSLAQLLAVAPESSKKHFECMSCAGFLRRFSSMVSMNDDGSLESVLMQALEENPYFSAKLLAGDPNLFSDAKTDLQRSTPIPVARLNFSFSKSVSSCDKAEGGSFYHLYGGGEYFRQNYNERSVSENTTKRAVAVWENMQKIFISGEKIIALQARLEKEIDHPEALGLLTPYAELLEHVKGMKKNQVRYLSSLLQLRQYSWLDQIENKIAGTVLEKLRDPTNTPENISGQLTMLVRQLKARTANGAYKEKSAPASDGLVENTVKFLKEKSWDNALARQIPTMSELPSSVWHPSAIEDNKKEVKTPTATSVLDAAASKLLSSKSGAAGAGAIEAGIEAFTQSAPSSIVSISMKAFGEKVSEFAKMEINFSGAPLYPSLVTAPVDGKAYPELFKYTLTDDFSSLGMLAVMNVTPIAPSVVVAALCGHYSKTPESFPEDNSFYEVQGFSSTLKNSYRVYLRGIADYFVSRYADMGSLILGVNIAEAHYGLSRGLVELAKQIPIQYKGAETGDGAGGLELTVGMVMRCTKKDGSMQNYRIASEE